MSKKNPSSTPVTAQRTGPDPNVLLRLHQNDKGEVVKSMANLTTILTEDDAWKGKVAYDNFGRTITFAGVALEEQHLIGMRLLVGRCYGWEPPKGMMRDVLNLVARRQQSSPVRDFLEGLKWDGVTRASTWLHHAFGIERSTIHDAFARRFLISAVARGLDPGCKVDTVLMLIGPQGVGKSTVFKMLAGDEWFSDTELRVGSRDALMQLAKAWIYEVAELASFVGVREQRIKGFISSAWDTYRQPYGQTTLKLPRQTVFVATTNEDAPLNDPTGNRRIWPVAVSDKLDRQWLKDNRDQLWAEAVDAYRRGEPWHLMPKEEALHTEHCRQFEYMDPLTDPVEAWALSQSGAFTVKAVIEGALGKPDKVQDKGYQNRVGTVLRRLGYGKRKAHRGELADGTRPWLWEKNQ